MRFVFETPIQVPVAELAAWHFRAGAFTRLQPPWAPVREIEPAWPVTVGRRPVFEGRLGPFPFRWEAEYVEVHPESGFTDRMMRGPFARWEHRHRFLSLGTGGCLLRDEVDCELIGGTAGRRLGAAYARRQIERLFHFRQNLTRGDLERWTGRRARFPKSVLIAGGTGLIGRGLTAFLRSLGITVWVLTRRPGGVGDIGWDPVAGRLESGPWEECEAVVNLAGEGIASRRWTEAYKKRLVTSRVDSTGFLCRRLAGLPYRPQVFISASAVGIYETGAILPTGEVGPLGNSFLARLCQAWEDSTRPARNAGMRTVLLRVGLVLTPAGGALAKMLPIFRMGLGGPIGRGTQRLSWIGQTDLEDLILTAMVDERYEGPLNAVAPTAPTNAELATVLGRVLGRPARWRAPAWALRAVFGEMAEATMLADQAAAPVLAQSLGFAFRHPGLEDALRSVLGRTVT